MSEPDGFLDSQIPGMIVPLTKIYAFSLPAHNIRVFSRAIVDPPEGRHLALHIMKLELGLGRNRTPRLWWSGSSISHRLVRVFYFSPPPSSLVFLNPCLSLSFFVLSGPNTPFSRLFSPRDATRFFWYCLQLGWFPPSEFSGSALWPWPLPRVGCGLSIRQHVHHDSE